MEQPKEELEQIASWFSEEGLAPDSPKEAQLCLLWSALQRTRSRLNSVTWDLDSQRSQHLAEMAEVRKSLEQIRIFTEHKDVLAQEIQDENDHLKDQLRRIISLQDAQISEVAKMLYQQGLTDLIHSSPSEQVAYLLVERASLLEACEDPSSVTGDGNTASLLDTKAQALNTNVHQSTHKGAPRHSQSPWKRLFGLHKASQSKHTFIPTEARHLASQASSVERECSRLERDLEEGSRRLAMAHNEIRRLTDELESAHLTQRAYEPELQAAQQEVEQLRQEVQKVKKYEMVELRKAKELNDRLDLEIRTLRNQIRTLDAEKGTLQQTVVSLQEKAERLELALQEQQQVLTVQVQANRATQQPEVISLQREVQRLEAALQEQQQQAEQHLLNVQLQANQVHELAESQANELSQSNVICRDLQNKLSAQSRCILEKESEIHLLKQQMDASNDDLDKLIASICTKENNIQDQKKQHCENGHRQVKDEELPTQNEENTLHKVFPDYQESVNTLLATQEECEMLKKEICETLKCLDKERSKYHEMKEKHKVKLCRAKQKCGDETTWRDEKIKHLERELSLCSHSVAKEKELTLSITQENEKLLVERRRLLQQLNEEEHNKKDSNLTASLSKCRVDFLEMENKKLRNKILNMSNQLAVLERSLQNMQSLHFAEELKKTSNLLQVFKSLPVQTSSVKMAESSEIEGLLDDSQTDVTSSPHCFISRSAEMGYLNLISAQKHSTPLAAFSRSDSTCS
ncbi:coiled-coil domain-containing protein 30 [Centropristis striata]|uniref:coiled-coil domain-containing protein 30 n=1 Tax=Centropristis striata TaxID=184440 RepID=UPI0027E1B358|nr:coiled-coil domain-containing protein 30 [Centropristis striata]